MRKSVGLAAALVAYGSFLADAEAAYTTPYRFISPDSMRQICWWQGGDPWSRVQSYGCVTATRAYECSARTSQCFLTVYEGSPPAGVIVVPLRLGGGHKHPPYYPPPKKPPVPPKGNPFPGTVVFPPKPGGGGTVVFPPRPPQGGGGTVVFPPKGGANPPRPGGATVAFPPKGGGTVVFPPKGGGSGGGGKPPPGGGSPSGGGSPIKQN